MKTESRPNDVRKGEKGERADQTVLVIGGSGGMSNRYRDVVEKRGWSLRHYENRLPAGARKGTGKIALVVIMVSMVSHSLLQQVQSMGLEDAQIVYLRSASISALRAVVDQWAA
jgi:UDP-N-acetylglucosamine:LPS N-acetylglucosamine transferase